MKIDLQNTHYFLVRIFFINIASNIYWLMKKAANVFYEFNFKISVVTKWQGSRLLAILVHIVFICYTFDLLI